MDIAAHPAAWTPSRAAGLTRAKAFQPSMGSRYTNRRNYDQGPGRHDGVSQLSPYVRRRLVTERELVDLALASHDKNAAEKFIHEVFWRTYFKGWLENRPSVWTQYRTGLERDLAGLGGDKGLAKRVRQAEDGATGIECFDAWAEELVETGYLHNHARMWFASIWVFTLGLPWRIGADFFLRHLIDGDPASNTLGWRWVAGLHTKGKAYEAQAWNIEKFTGGRFRPAPRDLNANIVPLEEAAEVPPSSPPRTPSGIQSGVPSALLIHEDDCRVEDFAVPFNDLAGVATLRVSHLRSPREVAPYVHDFDTGALADAAARASEHGAPEAKEIVADRPERLIEWAERAGAKQIITPFIPVGPTQDYLLRAAPALKQAGIRLAEVRRDWDSLTWPHATAGFFKVKKAIPKVLSQLG
ncbi:MAG: FAD-binding domain-containing protein [Pseudomonadota bacterium]